MGEHGRRLQRPPARAPHLADSLWALHTNDFDYLATATADDSLKDFQVALRVDGVQDPAPGRAGAPRDGRTGAAPRRVRQVDRRVLVGRRTTLLAIFQESITRPENTVRWRWSPGDVAFWDNRTTQHYGVADFGDLPRQHERITVSGGVPVSIDGRASKALVGSDASFTRVGLSMASRHLRRSLVVVVVAVAWPCSTAATATLASTPAQVAGREAAGRPVRRHPARGRPAQLSPHHPERRRGGQGHPLRHRVEHVRRRSRGARGPDRRLGRHRLHGRDAARVRAGGRQPGEGGRGQPGPRTPRRRASRSW